MCVSGNSRKRIDFSTNCKTGRKSKGGEVNGSIAHQDLGKEMYRVRIRSGCANAYDTGYTAEVGSVCFLAHLLLFMLVSFYQVIKLKQEHSLQAPPTEFSECSAQG